MIAFQEKRGIGSSESKRIREDVFEIGFPRDVGNVVQIAIRVRSFVVDGRRDLLVVKSQVRKFRLPDLLLRQANARSSILSS